MTKFLLLGPSGLESQFAEHASSRIDVMRLSYNLKNMENINNGEIEVKGNDLQLNNQNVELDFAEENEEDESLATDDYSTPYERQESDQVKTFFIFLILNSDTF